MDGWKDMDLLYFNVFIWGSHQLAVVVYGSVYPGRSVETK